MPIATNPSSKRCDITPPETLFCTCATCGKRDGPGWLPTIGRTGSSGGDSTWGSIRAKLHVGTIGSGQAETARRCAAATRSSILFIPSGVRFHALARENKLEQRAFFAVRKRRQLPAMALDDGSADRQPQSHSVRFGRDERIKDTVQPVGIDSGPRIFHHGDNRIGVMTLRDHLQQSNAIR